jgi:hypothetical protein
MPIKVTIEQLDRDIHNFRNVVDQDESRRRGQSLYNKYNWRKVFDPKFPDIFVESLG